MEANSKANPGRLKQSPHKTEEQSEEIEHAPELTKFQEHILRLICEIEAAGRKQYGLNIKRELESYYGEEINHGRLYPNLDQLIEEGLVEKSEFDKRTNKYEVTERGRRVLAGIGSNFAQFAPEEADV